MSCNENISHICINNDAKNNIIKKLITLCLLYAIYFVILLFNINAFGEIEFPKMCDVIVLIYCYLPGTYELIFKLVL